MLMQSSMKKTAILFVLAVYVPSLVLAWLAVRSLRDQQFVLERQQSLLYQGVADRLAKDAADLLAERQREFGGVVEAMFADREPNLVARGFDQELCKAWAHADVGFVVTLTGALLSPSPLSGPQARMFCVANGAVLGNRESVEVYWNTPKGAINISRLEDNRVGQLKDETAAQPSRMRTVQPAPNPQQQPVQQQTELTQQRAQPNAPADNSSGQTANNGAEANNDLQSLKSNYAVKNPANLKRTVEPQQAFLPLKGSGNENEPVSKVTAAEAEFRQLIGESSEGTLARFVDNKLKVMFWYRPARDPQLVFGAQLDLKKLVAELQPLVRVESPLHEEVCVALLDDAARPVAVSHAGFQPATWKRPFAATEVGESLPHWEMAVYPLDPEKLGQSARTLALTIALIVAVLLIAISSGGWLIFADLRRQLALARQKTDFVSNVSHELKTPLTSIRMFSELLAGGRVSDVAKQRSYLQIITAETARLTRLINNVLDFSRMERGEKKYNFTRCDLGAVVSETVETYRPHLEQAGFKLEVVLPPAPVEVNGDRDALAQVLVNLLSNAEKYSGERKEIRVELRRNDLWPNLVSVRVLDRGLGVPRGSEGKIFEQFYRAHDALSSGIEGSGLGLSLARQIARAHGGEIGFERRENGGSEFVVMLRVVA